MSQLVKFGDVIESITIRVDDPQTAGVDRYVGLEHLDSETVTVGRWGSPSDVEATKLRFFIGDVIYGRRRAYQRKLGRANFEGICSAHALVLRGKAKKCLSEFLPYFLQSERFHKRAMEISVGSLSPTINWSTLKVQEFAFPGLDEQAQIVELMTAVDEHLDALRTQLEVAKSSRAAVLHQLLSAGGDDWVNTTLGDILSFVSTRVMPENVSSNTPYVGLEHVDPKTPLISRWGEVASVSSSVTPFEPEDVLFGRLRPYLHKVSVADFPGVCTPEILVLRSSAMCRSRFLHLLCSLNSTINACIEMSAGTRMPRTSTTDLAKIQVQLPTIVEQERIVEIVSSMDDVIQATEQAIAEAKVLRTTLLNQEIS
jgi:type I restriction enzyme S subunit